VAAEERPALTASARVGRDNTRSGREKACGAVEQKKGTGRKKEKKKEGLGA
jgi:hypothetical protein